MSVFHRIDKVKKLSPKKFFRYAIRLPHYPGATAFAIQEFNGPQPEPQFSHSAPSSNGRPQVPQQRREVESSRAVLSNDPALGGLIEWGDSRG